MNLRQAWAVAIADFKERMRRPPVYMAMGVAAFLCYLAMIDQATVAVGNGRGVWNSAWSAGTLAVQATSYITLVCFFIVRNGVQRDEETGAGKLVATSLVSNFSYLTGKWISNLGVLAAITLVFIFSAPVLQWVHHAGYGFSVWGFLQPFLWITMPAAAFVAAIAVLFECHPWLKRGVGNVIYIMAWVEMLRESGMDDRPWTDMVGFYTFMKSVEAAAAAGGLKIERHSLNIGHAEFDRWTIFTWNGFAVHWQDVLLRLEWFAVALALVAIAVYFFKRFDPDTRPAVRFPVPRFLRRANRAVEATSGKWETELLRLAPLENRTASGRFLGIVRAELRLLLKSIPKVAYVALGFANLIALVAPEKDGPGMGVLAFLWIVPVIVWSNMGAREQAPHARPLIFSAPHSFLRQLPAEWVAGILIALGVSAGIGVRLITRGHLAQVAVWMSGAMFIASMAIACGTWSRSTRLFQGLYTGWWYLALNNAPNMDFTGITGQRHAVGYAITSALLFGSAMAQRWWFTERAAALRAFGFFGVKAQEKIVEA